MLDRCSSLNISFGLIYNYEQFSLWKNQISHICIAGQGSCRRALDDQVVCKWHATQLIWNSTLVNELILSRPQVVLGHSPHVRILWKKERKKKKPRWFYKLLNHLPHESGPCTRSRMLHCSGACTPVLWWTCEAGTVADSPLTCGT